MNQQIVLLTGASAGIGKQQPKCSYSMAIKCMVPRVRVAIAQKAPHGSGEIIPVIMDVNNEDQILAVINRIVAENGKLDVLICNAGNGIADHRRYLSWWSALSVRNQFLAFIKPYKPLFRFSHTGIRKNYHYFVGCRCYSHTFSGFYSSVKSALLCFYENPSLEVKPFGIQCCTVLPAIQNKLHFGS